MFPSLSAELRERVESVRSGRTPNGTLNFRDLRHYDTRTKLYGWTARMLQVLTLIAGGYTNKEMADAMEIDVETAKTHVVWVLNALEAKNRAHAVCFGYEAGLLELGTPPP